MAQGLHSSDKAGPAAPLHLRAFERVCFLGIGSCMASGHTNAQDLPNCAGGEACA
jgi:hypothetical protein